jgi:hypothetical protein
MVLQFVGQIAPPMFFSNDIRGKRKRNNKKSRFLCLGSQQENNSSSWRAINEKPFLTVWYSFTMSPS